MLGKNKKKSSSIYIGLEMHGCIYKRHNRKKNEIEMKKKTFVVYIHHTVFKISVFTMQKRKRVKIDVNKTGSILFTRLIFNEIRNKQ